MRPPESLQDQLAYAWEHIGGIRGTLLATVPIAVFVAANALAGMWPAIGAAVGAAVLVGGAQVLRKEKPGAAFAGLGGVVVASAVAVLVGNAKGFYLWGIWITLAIGIVLLASVLVRRPLIGLVWSVGNGHDSTWRTDPRSRRDYDVATLFWAALCFLRFAVQNWLYVADETTWLGIARIAMGWPLTLVAVLVTAWAVRRVDRHRAEQHVAPDMGSATTPEEARSARPSDEA